MTTTAQARPQVNRNRPNAPQVKRSLSILQPVQADGRGRIQLTITKGRKADVDVYDLTTFPAFDGAAVGVQLDNRTNGETYHVCLATGAYFANHYDGVLCNLDRLPGHTPPTPRVVLDGGQSLQDLVSLIDRVIDQAEQLEDIFAGLPVPWDDEAADLHALGLLLWILRDGIDGHFQPPQAPAQPPQQTPPAVPGPEPAPAEQPRRIRWRSHCNEFVAMASLCRYHGRCPPPEKESPP